MTDSSRCSDLLSSVLLAVLLALFPLRVSSQQSAWRVPQFKETVRVSSVNLGHAFSRDTYLSASRYDGWETGFDFDSWRGYNPDRLFSIGRIHSSLLFSPLRNRLDGGRTYQLIGSFSYAGLWHAVDCNRCDLLIGPAGVIDVGALYNLANSNNPVNGEGYVAAGICIDNTFRFRLMDYPLALQATLFLPLAGVGVAPDYDQPYWFMYKYKDYGKALHFVSPFNNTAFIQQIALAVPVCNGCMKMGYTVDYMKNRLGGQYTCLYNGYFSIGYAVRLQSKEWGR